MEHPPRLAALIRKMIADARSRLLRFFGGTLTVRDWQQQQARALARFHVAAFLLGGNTRTVAPSDRSTLSAIIAEQQTYLAGFAKALAEGVRSQAQHLARATLYAGALRRSYSAGQWSGWPLPFHPGQGTPCRCGCSWHATNVDTERGDADFQWVLGGAERHCTICPQRAAASPYRIRQGTLA